MMKRLLLVLSLATVSLVAGLIPRPAGEMSFDVPGKGKQTLSQYRGKVVMLVAFLTTCPHCQRATRIMTGIQRDFASKGLQVIEVGFSDRDTPETIKNFVATYKPNFPVGLVDGEYFVKWSLLTPDMRPTVPMVFIIDRKGMVQAQYMGGDPMMQEEYQDQNLRAKLMQYLGGKITPADLGKAPGSAKPHKK